VRGLTTRLVEWAAQAPGVEPFTPVAAERRAGIVAFATQDIEGDSRKLREARVTHSVREGAVRLSPHFHNTMEEVERVIGVLEG
jgi:selenocysteine lyase/cysteine desulfurase